MRATLSLALVLAVPALFAAHAAREAGQPNEYALSNGATLDLSPGWSPQQLPQIPPPPPLAVSAPSLSFSDFLSFQNSSDHSELAFALSNNPFLGRDSYWLDTEMHKFPPEGDGVLTYLFYFFFPPPYACLNAASAQYDRVAREASDSDDKNSTPRDISVDVDCEYAPSLPAFFSQFVSPSLKFWRADGREHREGALQKLYLLPMDRREFDGLTFFIFEAQSTRPISLETTNRFNLPDSLQGMQADFFWAVGAPSPFPFSRIATLKNVPLVHVAYAGVAFGANKKPDFLRILQTVRIPHD